MQTNSEIRRVDFLTRLHTGRNVSKRVMIGNKSRAGAVKSRNCFTATNPSEQKLTREDLTAGGIGPFHVARGKKFLNAFTGQFEKVATYGYATMTQAQCVARAQCGYVVKGE